MVQIGNTLYNAVSFAQSLALSECNRQTQVGDVAFCQIIVEWAMRTFVKLQLRWTCDCLYNYFRQVRYATEKVEWRCGFLSSYSSDSDVALCKINMTLSECNEQSREFEMLTFTS